MEREPSKHWQIIRNAMGAGHLREATLQNYNKAQLLGITLPPPVPKQNIKPNLHAFRTYRENLHPRNRVYADAIMSHLDKVSFHQLKQYLQQLAAAINEHCQKYAYDAIYLFIRGREKSEYWILQLLFPFLNFEIRALLEIGRESSMKMMKTWPEILSANHPCLILVDDGTYSGTQCADHICSIIEDLIHIKKDYPTLFIHPKLEIVFGFAYATLQAITLIANILNKINEKQFFTEDSRLFIRNIHQFYIKQALTHNEIEWKEFQKDYQAVLLPMLVENIMHETTLIYTDWRTPDNLSSITRFFKAEPPIQFCTTNIIRLIELKRKGYHTTRFEEIIPTQLTGPYKKTKMNSTQQTASLDLCLK